MSLFSTILTPSPLTDLEGAFGGLYFWSWGQLVSFELCIFCSADLPWGDGFALAYFWCFCVFGSGMDKFGLDGCAGAGVGWQPVASGSCFGLRGLRSLVEGWGVWGWSLWVVEGRLEPARLDSHDLHAFRLSCSFLQASWNNAIKTLEFAKCELRKVCHGRFVFRKIPGTDGAMSSIWQCFGQSIIWSKI